MMNETTIKEILPSEIIFDAGTQARVRTDIKTCQAYIQSMQDGVEFPPLDVFSDGSSPKYVLADGFHRLQSHCSFRPTEPIRCRVHLGTVADAQWFAITANKTHGLRRTNEDKRKAVKMALLHPKGVEMSNVKIAEEVGVAESSVRNIRGAMESGSQIAKVKTRIGKDGKTYPVRKPRPNEPPEPKTNFRTNADGKTVNVKGFDFRDHRRCDQCGLWSLETGLCAKDDAPQPSWTPACTDWRKRHSELEPCVESNSQRLQMNQEKDHSQPGSAKAAHVRQGHVKCKLYPDNAELSAIEIRHVLGEKFLAALGKAIKLVMNEE